MIAKEHSRPYKLVHQLLCISNINFESLSYIGMVELHVIAQDSNLRTIKINCKQMRIFKVDMNDVYPCTFTYNDPSLEICQEECKQRNIDAFSSAHLTCISSTDPEKNNGEIIIQVPDDLLNYVQEGKILRISVEFAAETPLGGVHFGGGVPRKIDDPNYSVTVPHLFTYGHENSSRLWFPSVDSYSEPCSWKLEFTVDASMVAVSCGDLVDVIYTHDKKRKTYHYQLNIPTCAPAIGLAVGPFEVIVDPNMHEVTHFCLPHLRSHLQATCSFLHEAFEFYEELLSTRYPYTCYKQVFVDEAYGDCISYASMSIFDVNLLHSKHIIDQTYDTRNILASAIAKQFFGTFITMNAYSDCWLTRGISAHLSSQYRKKAFGNNEYRFFVNRELHEVIAYEQTHGGVILDPSKTSDNDNSNALYFSYRYPHTVSPLYDEIHRKKSHLIIRMLEDRIGRELMLQVFNKLLSLAINASQQKITANTLMAWINIQISTSSFTKVIFNVTGKEIGTFLGQWVHIGGHPKFHGSFAFNRKRNIVELEIKQLETTSLGIRKYMGPITVWIQELDGTFKHNLQVEENTTKHDITCHSKSRRNKKKKIPLCTGEEVDMDLSNMDADSPVLWIRIDPDMQLLRQVAFEQPDINWQYQLRYERDVTAQAEAIEQLKRFPTQLTRKALLDIVENEHCFYKIRCMAATAVTHVSNEMASQATGPPAPAAMINVFRKLYGSFSCPQVPKLNNFSNFQLYFLQKTLPVAMAGLRSAHKICPPEVLRFILDLFKYNDNSKNKFSDNYYRSALVDALAASVTPCVSAVLARTSLQQQAESLPQETKLILEEIVRYFNLDKLLPCYKLTVSVSCLKAIRHLQKMGHLPSNSAFYQEYARYGVFIDVRMAAIECLIDITKVEQRKEDLAYLLDIIEHDPLPKVRHLTILAMIENPPITKKDVHNPLNTEDIVERLWRLMNNCLYHDSKLRCAVVDLYYTFYGRGRPSCLPKPEFSMVLNLKEKKAVISTALSMSPSQSNREDRPTEPEPLDAFSKIIALKRPVNEEFLSNKKRRLSAEGSHISEDDNAEPSLGLSETKISEEDLPISDPSDLQLNLQQPTPSPLIATELSPRQESSPLVLSLSDRNNEDVRFTPPSATLSGEMASTPIPPSDEMVNRQQIDFTNRTVEKFELKLEKSERGERGEKEKKKKDKDRDREREDGGSSKPHKDKKKKKKKHKHKHKHKHRDHDHHSPEFKDDHDNPADMEYENPGLAL